MNDVENLLEAATTAESSMAWAVGMLQEAATVMHATQKIVKLERITGKIAVPHKPDEWVCCECGRVNADRDSKCRGCEAAREEAQVEDLEDCRLQSDDEGTVVKPDKTKEAVSYTHLTLPTIYSV